MSDERMIWCLKSGDKIYYEDNKWFEITEKPVGFGGGSIIYPARKYNSEYEYILKECFPMVGNNEFKYIRKNGQIVPSDSLDIRAMEYLSAQRRQLQDEYQTGIDLQGDRTIVPSEILVAKEIETGGIRYQVNTEKFLVIQRKRGYFLKDIISKAKNVGEIGKVFGNENNVYIIALLMEQILRALDFVHKKNYLYGDLQEGNIYLSDCDPQSGKIGYACLLDFGCSRKVREYEDGILKTDYIERNMIYSTPGYRVPELYKKDRMVRLDRSMDTYAAGRLMLYLFTGEKCIDDELFFRDRTRRNLYFYQNVNNEINCKEELRLDINTILDKALNRHPERRYLQASFMLDAVEKLVKKSQPPKYDLALHLPILRQNKFIGRFIGREEELDKIELAYRYGVSPIEVYGFGGLGKTELVIQYARQMEQKYKGSAYFVTFSGSMRNTIVKMADFLCGFERNNLDGSLKTECEVYEEMFEYLNQLGENDILIIDNVDAEDKEYNEIVGNDDEDNTYSRICRLKLHVIITTRKERPEGIEIKTMSECELLELAKQYANNNVSDEELKEIIYILERHTLAVELAAKMIGNGNRVYPPITSAVILEKLKAGKMAQIEQRIESTKNCITKKLTFSEHIGALFDIAALPPNCCRVMAELLFFSQDGTDIDVLFMGDKKVKQNQIDLLIEGGWLREVNGKLAIHALIKSVCYEKLYKKEYNKIEKFAMQLQLIVELSNYKLESEKREQIAEYLLNFSNNIVDKENYMNTAVNLLLELGKVEEAKRYGELGLKRYKRLFKKNDIRIADSYFIMGRIYQRLSYNEKSLKYYTNALQIFKKDPETNIEEIADCYLDIGNVYLYERKNAKSLKKQKKAYKIYKTFETKKVKRWICYGNMGLNFCALGKIGEGVKCQEKALKNMSKVLDEQDPQLAVWYGNLGREYRMLGKYNKALKYGEKALEMRKTIKEIHPETARCYANLGLIYKDFKKYEQGLECEQKAIEIQKKVLGENHPETAASYFNSAQIYYDKKEYEKGLEYGTKALEIFKRIYGKKHLDIAAIYWLLGDIYFLLGNNAKYLECRKKILKIRKKNYGGVSLAVANSCANLAEIYWEMNELKKGVKYARKALRIRKVILGEKHPETAASYANIGLYYCKMGKKSSGEKYKEKASNILKIIKNKE